MEFPLSVDEGFELLAASADRLAAQVTVTDDWANLSRSTIFIPATAAAVIERISRLTSLSADAVINRLLAIGTERLDCTPTELHDFADALASEEGDRDEVAVSLSVSLTDAMENICAGHQHEGGMFMAALMIVLAQKFRQTGNGRDSPCTAEEEGTRT